MLPARASQDSPPPLSLAWVHILLALADEPRHGYAIMQDVKARTGGAVLLWPATLYGAIRRMVRAGLIEETASAREHTRRRSYRLTPSGRALLATEMRRLAELVDAARRKRVLAPARSPR
jgi:DNA-binding PadR family transcriptional regulator